MEKKLKVINDLNSQICETSSDSEMFYALIPNTLAARNTLLSAGFTPQQIREVLTDDKTHIDIAMLAYYYTDAENWARDGGFTTSSQQR